MRDTVLYVGGFGLPDRTASALRALGNAAVLRAAGYRVVVAGKFAQIPDPASQPLRVQGFDCHDIREPLAGTPRRDYTLTPANIEALLALVGPERVVAVMAYNFPGFGLARLIRVAHRLGIPVINESTEWYGWEGFRPVTNVRRILESRWRNNGLVREAGNLVCATRWSQARHPGVNALVLPFALDPGWDCWQTPPNEDWCAGTDALRFVYSGSPGLGMHKDRLPLIVQALDRVAGDSRDYRFAVVGMSAQDYLRSVPAHAAILRRHAGRLRFLGRRPHRDAVGVLRAADFSIFVRERNRVSEVGFPTKYAEAVTCGVPVFTNRSSDIGDYLRDGDNGILLPDCGADALAQGLQRAFDLSRAERAAMKARVAADNPFAVQAWVPRMRAFMQNLRMPR
ncbi:glycosyltransferase family 4 protein [Thermomonas aquatica]|uniref:Glycosyltransferase family 4 protein n=1 Tax=Thermomonas aquatica TaxID=2202149 RepID=A0A5B7ZLW5_9GAMM|nr:glycosyltransferase family 4 protein [Thermomonas aquatica]